MLGGVRKRARGQRLVVTGAHPRYERFLDQGGVEVVRGSEVAGVDCEAQRSEHGISSKQSVSLQPDLSAWGGSWAEVETYQRAVHQGQRRQRRGWRWPSRGGRVTWSPWRRSAVRRFERGSGHGKLSGAEGVCERVSEAREVESGKERKEERRKRVKPVFEGLPSPQEFETRWEGGRGDCHGHLFLPSRQTCTPSRGGQGCTPAKATLPPSPALPPSSPSVCSPEQGRPHHSLAPHDRTDPSQPSGIAPTTLESRRGRPPQHSGTSERPFAARARPAAHAIARRYPRGACTHSTAIEGLWFLALSLAPTACVSVKAVLFTRISMLKEPGRSKVSDFKIQTSATVSNLGSPLSFSPIRLPPSYSPLVNRLLTSL